MASTYITALGALAPLLSLLPAGLRLARPGSARRLVLREVLALDRTRRLHLVACDGREVLLLTGGGADVVVSWLPAPEGQR